MPIVQELVQSGRYADLFAFLQGPPTPSDPTLCLERARAAWELGLGERARAEIDQARHVLVRAKNRAGMALAYVWLARVEIAFGTPERAVAPLEKATAILESSSTPEERTLFAAARGELAVALRAADSEARIEPLEAGGRETGDAYAVAWAAVLAAIAAIDSEDVGAVTRAADRLSSLPASTRALPDVAWRVLAVQAAATNDASMREQAVAALKTLADGLPAEVSASFATRWDRARLAGAAAFPMVATPDGRDLRRLSRIIRTMISESDVDTLLRLIIDSMVQSSGAEAGLLVLIDKERVDLSVRRGPGGRDLATEDVPLSLRIARDVASSGRTLCLADASDDAAWKAAQSVAEKGLRSVLCVPLRFRERAMGSVFLECRSRSAAFGPRDVETAEVLADQAAVILENALLQAKATVDALTGASTHAAFERRLGEEVSRAARQRTKCSLLLVDLDRFKQINDVYGHDAGSRVLCEFAETVRKVLRTSDVPGRVDAPGTLVGRYGGDEFEVILPETDRAGLESSAARLLSAIRGRRFECGGTRVEVTASVGGATYPDDAADPRELFLRADEALYAAKRAGRDRYAPFRPAPPREAPEKEVDELLLSRYGRDVISLLGKVLDAGDSLQTALDEAVKASVKATGAERGFVVLFDGKDQVTVRSAFNLPEDSFGPDRFRMSFGAITRAVRDGRPVRSTHPSTDSRFDPHGSVEALGLASILAVPIPQGDGAAGVLYLDTKSSAKSFTAEDETLLLRFASFLGRTLRLAMDAHDRRVRLDVLETALAAGLRDLQAGYRFDALLGESEAMRKVRQTLDHIVGFPYPVLVVGETGTGKEVVAKAIHANSPRRESPMLSVNCAALPRELQESELFGHVRGAFTGADKDRPGLFKAAHRGSLFLDEIGETSEELQRKLLRVLQEGEYVPVGAIASQKCDVRIIAATNRDLEEEVRQGRFRQDLYYRLKVFRLAMPPLRDRLEDIPLLARHFLEKAVRETGARAKELHPDTLRALSRHTWPGNVRELENAIRYAIAFSAESVKPEHLPSEVLEAPRARVATETAAQVSAQGAPLSIEDLWKVLIQKTLEEVRWNISAASKLLGVSRTTLHYKIRTYGLRKPE